MAICVWNNHVLQDEDPCILASEGMAAGWGAGTDIGGTLGAIEGIAFSTEASVFAASTLTSPRSMGCGVTDEAGRAGFILGGADSGASPVATVSRFLFDGESCSDIAATISTPLYSMCGVQSLTEGYGMGGCTNAVSSTSVINKLTFSALTAGAVAATLVAARPKAVNAGLVDPAGIGYCCGGYTSYPTRSNEVDGIIFGTDTAVNPAAALSSTLAESMGASSATAGYVMGGESTSFNSYIRKFDFAAETFSLLAGVLSATVSRGCGVNSLTVGYTLGGNSSSFVTTDSIDGVDFASDTGNNPSAVLSTAKRHQASLSNKV